MTQTHAPTMAETIAELGLPPSVTLRDLARIWHTHEETVAFMRRAAGIEIDGVFGYLKKLEALRADARATFARMAGEAPGAYGENLDEWLNTHHEALETMQRALESAKKQKAAPSLMDEAHEALSGIVGRLEGLEADTQGVESITNDARALLAKIGGEL